MKSNVKLNKLFNLNNMFTLLLIVILILVIVCCVRKTKSNKENFLDWTPLPCDKNGKTNWKSSQHFGDIRCLDGEYGSSGAAQDPRAEMLGPFIEFTASEEGDLADKINLKTSPVMTDLESLASLLYMKFIYGLTSYDGRGNGKSKGDLKNQKDTILTNFKGLVFPLKSGDINDVDPSKMEAEDERDFKIECINKLSELIKTNLLDPRTEKQFNNTQTINSYFNGINFVEFDDEVDGTITVNKQKENLKHKYNWRKGDTKRTLLLSGDKNDDNAEWDDNAAIIAFENELNITYYNEKQEIENMNKRNG